jgi:hypothetical protein
VAESSEAGISVLCKIILTSEPQGLRHHVTSNFWDTTTLVLFKSKNSVALPAAAKVRLVRCLGAEREPLSAESSAQKVAFVGDDQGGPRLVLSALESSHQRDYAYRMRPSSGRRPSGAVFGLLGLLLMLVPVAMITWMTETLDPAVVDSLEYRFRSYLAGASSPILQGLHGALGGLVLLAVASYLVYLAYSVLRGGRPAVRNPKPRRIA